MTSRYFMIISFIQQAGPCVSVALATFQVKDKTMLSPARPWADGERSILRYFKLWIIWTNPSQRPASDSLRCFFWDWTPTCLDSFPCRWMKLLVPLFWRYRGGNECGGPAEMEMLLHRRTDFQGFPKCVACISSFVGPCRCLQPVQISLGWSFARCKLCGNDTFLINPCLPVCVSSYLCTNVVCSQKLD